MPKDIFSFVLALLAAPIAGIALAGWILISLVQISRAEGVGEIAQWCAASGAGTHIWCVALTQARELLTLSFMALGITVLLPLGYWITVRMLAKNRAALGNGFPVLVRICLLVLPLILLVHAALVGFVTYEAMSLELVRVNGIRLAIVGALFLGLLLSAFNIIVGMRRMLAVEPVFATGLALGTDEMRELQARVRRIAQQLGTVEPRNIVVGVEPMPYMISMPVRLRGAGDLPEGETLYVPTAALRLLDDGELDALIARELAQFRGPDLTFSRRFAPAHAGLERALDDTDDGEGMHPLMRVAQLPALGLLAFMLWVLRRTLARVTLERETLADRSALEVAPAPKIASMIAKLVVLSAQWPAFREGLRSLMNRGHGRRNIAADYLQRTRAYLAAADQQQLPFELARMSVPHPFEKQHPSLGVRARALGVDEKPGIAAALVAIREDRAAAPEIIAIEERITHADLEYTRVPGHPIEISESAELPAELA